jgi:hypothetical protein
MGNFTYEGLSILQIKAPIKASFDEGSFPSWAPPETHPFTAACSVAVVTIH